MTDQTALFDRSLYEGYPQPAMGRVVRIDAPGHPADGHVGEIRETDYLPGVGLIARVTLDRAVCDESGDWFGSVSVPLIDCCPL